MERFQSEERSRLKTETERLRDLDEHLSQWEISIGEEEGRVLEEVNARNEEAERLVEAKNMLDHQTMLQSDESERIGKKKNEIKINK